MISHYGTTASIRLCCCGKSSVLDTVWLYVKPFVLFVFRLVSTKLHLINLPLTLKSIIPLIHETELMV